jgi:hypothetical protein
MEHLPHLAPRRLEVGETENAAGVIATEEFSSGLGLERTDGHKSDTSYTEASAGEDIVVDLVRDIENLTKGDAIARLLELEERHEKTFFEIGGVLSAIQKRKWFDPFASLDEWVENNTALSRSKARALTQIYDSVVTSGVKWAKVKHLEWTKLNAIAGLLDASNADHWVEVASNHGRAKIKQLVQEHLAGLVGQKPKGSTAARVKTFKFRDDQVKTVQAAIDRAKKTAGAADDSAGPSPSSVGIMRKTEFPWGAIGWWRLSPPISAAMMRRRALNLGTRSMQELPPSRRRRSVKVWSSGSFVQPAGFGARSSNLPDAGSRRTSSSQRNFARGRTRSSGVGCDSSASTQSA